MLPPLSVVFALTAGRFARLLTKNRQMSEKCDPPADASFLQRAFTTEQQTLSAQLRASARIVHYGDRGEVNEQHFIDFLRHYLLNRYTVEKAASVRKLKRTSVESRHAGGVYPPKPLIEIIAGILSIEVQWKDGFGEKFRSVHRRLQDDEAINCGFAAIGASFDVFSNDGDY